MLTQLSTLKSRLGLELFETIDDALLTNILRHVTARFSAECNRIFDYGAGLTFEFRADQRNIVVDRPPIESVSAFHLKSTEAEGWILQSSIDYLLSPKRAVIELALPLGTTWQFARVTYTGGYVLPGATPTGNQIALPDDVELACVEQAAYWYQHQRRRRRGPAIPILRPPAPGQSRLEPLGKMDKLKEPGGQCSSHPKLAKALPPGIPRYTLPPDCAVRK